MIRCNKCGKKVPKRYKKAHEEFHYYGKDRRATYTPEYKAWARHQRKLYC